MSLPELTDYLFIYISSTLKFVFGPAYGGTYNVGIFQTALFTFLGMMTSVVIVSYLGTEVRRRINERFFKLRKIISKKSRRFVKIWKKWGINGVAFFTPLLLTPIGGTALAVSFGAKRREIIVSMTISGAIWSILVSSGAHLFRDALANFMQ